MTRRLCVILCLALAPAALAETAPDSTQLTPIDRAVGDIDPLSRSLRTVERGLRYGGEHSEVYKPSDAALANIPTARSSAASPITSIYYLFGPGYLARVPRLNYVVRRADHTIGTNETPGIDGRLIPRVTNDLVYLIDQVPLRPGYRPEVTPGGPAPSQRVEPARVDLRVDARLDRRVEPRRVESGAAPGQ
ncbi:MAG: hypothetical protein K8S99_13940 [Planctomycetes bacterium]|nr:hypothetical protein [Planctomycetota bacterium]